MPTRIPLCVRLITAEIRAASPQARATGEVSSSVPCGVSVADVSAVLHELNRIWASADIQFQLQDQPLVLSVPLPSGSADVTTDDHFYLASQHRVRDALTLFVVDHFRSRSLAGMEAQGQGPRLFVATVKRVPARVRSDGLAALARVVAHEFGHVLELSHVNEITNLMYPGVLLRCLVTGPQAAIARGSRAARTLGGPGPVIRIPHWAR